MQLPKIARALSFAIGLATSGVASATPLTDGEAAFDRGDWSVARQVLRPLAEQGDASAQSYLGASYVASADGPSDRAMAISWLTKAANQGLAAAQFLLGQLYEGAFGQAVDMPLAAKWYRKAADQSSGDGVTDAQLRLARLYLVGSGVPLDETLAQQWFAKATVGLQEASDRGDIRSKTALGEIYERGEGTKADPERAQRLYLEVAAIYRRLADRGDPRAQIQLARMYARGMGLKRDKVLAAVWYRRAADQGYAEAQLALGELYGLNEVWNIQGLALGPADREDQVQAYVWMRLGATKEPSVLPASLENDLRGNLTPAERDEADRAIKAWRPVKEVSPADGQPIGMTTSQWAEADRLQLEWDPTPAQIDKIEQIARSYDMVLGSPAAPVTLVEYMSPTSPHAARFHNEVLPELKAKYIDTGKVRFVVRDFITPPGDIAVAGILLARCAGGQRYFDVLDAILREPEADFQSEDLAGGLRKIAFSMGMNDAQFQGCISDEAARKALAARVNVFGRYDYIDSVPTFVLGSEKILGLRSFDQYDRAIRRALGLPALPDPAAIRAAAEAARFPKGLYFRIVDRPAGEDPNETPPTVGDQRLAQIEGDELWLLGQGGFGPSVVEEAHATTDELGQPTISCRFSEDAGRRFGDFTTANVGRRVAMVWNGKVLTAPVINMPITGRNFVITGHFTAETTEQLARSLSQPES